MVSLRWSGAAVGVGCEAVGWRANDWMLVHMSVINQVGALLVGLGEWTCQSCLVISEALATERAVTLPRRVEGLRREMCARLIGLRDAVGKRRRQVDEQQHLGPLLSRLAAMLAPLGSC